jgi:hypothetical protein
MTGELYAKFLREKCIPEIKKPFGDLKDIIFQDDQDGKQRTQVAMNVVSEFFDERIEPEDGDAKLADVWPIENVWGILKEKVRGVTFKNSKTLVTAINKEWRKVGNEECAKMVEKIPSRLWKVIKNKGDQVYEH